MLAKFLIRGFLIAHGLVQGAVWTVPPAPDAPFDPRHSWLLASIGIEGGATRGAAVITAAVTGAAFVVAGALLFAGTSSWRATSIVAALVSVPLLLTYFHPWLI